MKRIILWVLVGLAAVCLAVLAARYEIPDGVVILLAAGLGIIFAMWDEALS